MECVIRKCVDVICDEILKILYYFTKDKMYHEISYIE